MEILYKDEKIVVINKPAGALVVPGRGQSEAHENDDENVGTEETQDTLKKEEPKEALSISLAKFLNVERVYVVHRLDMDTSGVLVFALTEEMHRTLCKLFEKNEVHKQYKAIVTGTMRNLKSVIRLNIKEDPRRKRRGKMVIGDKFHGKPSQTGYEVIREWGKYTLIDVFPKTGRTHQIRVHMQAIGHPLAIDPWYGGALKLGNMTRLTLHAETLEIPSLNFKFKAPLPEDFERLIKWLDMVFPVV